MGRKVLVIPAQEVKLKFETFKLNANKSFAREGTVTVKTNEKIDFVTAKAVVIIV